MKKSEEVGVVVAEKEELSNGYREEIGMLMTATGHIGQFRNRQLKLIEEWRIAWGE